MKSTKQLLLTLGVLLGCACSSSKPPAQQLAQSESAIRAASAVSAKGTPQSEKHLRMAEDRMQLAKALSDKGQYKYAGATLEEARVEAELSLSLTQQQQAILSADRARQQADALE